jgi:glyoxylase-like metal-dependent hydrolase (beta-lactamase superfamily II)
LQRTSPQVGLHAESFGNPLGDYLSSLQLVRGLPIRTVLPGHGAPFTDLAGRADELLEHHQTRLSAMLAMVDDEELTAYALASRLSWRGAEDGWDRLAPFQRRMALTETIAHLEYLYGAGRVAKRFRGGVIYYRRQLR